MKAQSTVQKINFCATDLPPTQVPVSTILSNRQSFLKKTKSKYLLSHFSYFSFTMEVAMQYPQSKTFLL
jgi:hypothetical protein